MDWLIDWLVFERFAIMSIDCLIVALLFNSIFPGIMSQFLSWKKSKLDLAVGRRAHLVEHGRSRYWVERTRGIRKLKYFFSTADYYVAAVAPRFGGWGGGVFDHFVHIIIHNPTIIASSRVFVCLLEERYGGLWLFLFAANLRVITRRLDPHVLSGCLFAFLPRF